MEKNPKVSWIHEFIYELKVGSVMTRSVICVDSQTPMRELRVIFREHRISGIPVVDHGQLVGLVSLEDFIKWLADGQQAARVSERMTTELVNVSEDSRIVEALRGFDKFGFGRFPVVSRDDGHLVGVLTRSDIFMGLLRKAHIGYLEENPMGQAGRILEDIVADRTVLNLHYGIVGNDFKRAGECASRLRRTLTRLGFPKQIVRRAAIATYEAEMNIIIYTQRGDIAAEVESDKLKIRAWDEGPGIADIEAAMRPGFSTAPGWVREMGFGAGMGFYNIKRCSDRLNVDSTVGKGTRLEFDLSLN